MVNKEPDREKCIRALRKYYEKVEMILSHHKRVHIYSRGTTVDKIINNTRLKKPRRYGKGFAGTPEEFLDFTDADWR